MYNVAGFKFQDRPTAEEFAFQYLETIDYPAVLIYYNKGFQKTGDTSRTQDRWNNERT